MSYFKNLNFCNTKKTSTATNKSPYNILRPLSCYDKNFSGGHDFTQSMYLIKSIVTNLTFLCFTK